MKNAIGAATLAAALAAPSQSDAWVETHPTCTFSIVDPTGAWDCRQELHPSNQRTPEGLLLSTRLRIEECGDVAVEDSSHADPKKPNRVGTYVTGAGAAACLPEAVAEVNRELKAHAIKCGVEFAAAPTSEQPSRLEVNASCDGKGK